MPNSDIKVVQFRTSNKTCMGAVLIGHWLLDRRYEYPVFVDKSSEVLQNVTCVREIVFKIPNGSMRKLYEKMLKENSFFLFGL